MTEFPPPYPRMPELERLKQMNEQLRREVGITRERVSVSAAG